MKKLSLIVAMAVILTIGGVFATWTYNAGTVDGTNTTTTITLGQVDSTGAPGTLTAASTAKISIDNEQGDRVTRIDGQTGSVVVTFDPSATADLSYTDGVTVTWTVKITGDKNQYDSTTLLTASGTSHDLAVTTASGDGKFTGTIDIDDIVDDLTLAPITLESSAAHGEYSTALATYGIQIDIAFKAA